MLTGTLGVTSILVVALVVEPSLFGVHQILGPAQIIPFRGVLTLLLGVLALFAAAAWLVLRSSRDWIAVVLLVLLAGNAWNLGVLLDRGLEGEVQMDETHGALVVLSWNTQGGGASAEQIATLILKHEVDVAMLPETTAETATEIAGRLAQEGYEVSADITDGGLSYPITLTALVVRAELGEYRHDVGAGSTPGLPSGVWHPVDPTQPVLVAVHTAPPLPSMMGQWRAGLGWAAAQCDPDVVMAGDFNSTIDHWNDFTAGTPDADLAGCLDSAASVGSGAVGTWPTGVPKHFGAPIDHVLTGSQWQTDNFKVLGDESAARSDHRPVVAEVSRVD